MLRSVESLPYSHRELHGNFFYELELVHNIQDLIIDPNYSSHDVHWLNSRACESTTDQSPLLGYSLMKLHAPVEQSHLISCCVMV